MSTDREKKSGSSTIFDEPSLLGKDSVKKASPKSKAPANDNILSRVSSFFTKLFKTVFDWFNRQSRTVRLCVGIFGCVLLLSALLLVLLTMGNSQTAGDGGAVSEADEHEHEHVHYSSDDDYMLIDRESDELDYMTLENAEGHFTIVKDTEKGELVIEEIENLPQNYDFTEDIWFSALSIGYSYMIDITDDAALAEYGLNEPAAKIKCYYYDGSVTGFQIGNFVNGSEDNYYLLVDGYDGVYVTSVDSAFFLGTKYWVSDDIYDSDITGEVEIGQIDISLKDGEDFSLAPHVRGDKSDPFYDCSYILTAPYRCASYDYNTTLLINELNFLVAYEAVCVSPSGSELAEYGLDDPDMVVVHERNGVSKRFSTARASYDSFYLYADGIDVVYLFDSDSFPMLADMSIDLIRSSTLHTRYFDAVEQLTIKCGSKEYRFSINRKQNSVDSGLYEYSVYCNGNEIETSVYRQLLEQFNSAVALSFGGEAESDKPYLSVEISYFDGLSSEPEIINYLPAGDRRYLCEINGEGEAMIGTVWIDELLKLAEAAA